jgi:hypothetical protein
MAHRVNNLTFRPPFLAVLTIKYPDGTETLLMAKGIKQLPDIIEIRRQDILQKLQFEQGQTESAQTIFTLKVHIEYPGKTGPYLTATKDEPITQINCKRFLLFQMEEPN